MNVGAAFHDIRKSKRMTLKELSEKSGVALATLSRMENGRMTGTLESHISIAKALEVPLPELYKDIISPQTKTELQTKSARADVLVHDKKAASETLVSNASNKKMLPLIIKISKGGSTQKNETRPGIERFVYVLDGKVEASIGESKYNLAKGDTVYFESSAPHYFKNISTGESRLICISCPPA